MFFGWVFSLVSLGSPQVRLMGNTCGEPKENQVGPHWGQFERLGRRYGVNATPVHVTTKGMPGLLSGKTPNVAHAAGSFLQFPFQTWCTATVAVDGMCTRW